MRKYLPILTILTILLVGFSFMATPIAVHAQSVAQQPISSNIGNVSCKLLAFNATSCVSIITANVVDMILTAAGWLMSLAAMILDVSMVLTLHISDFVNSTPAIYTVWRILRDITGIFFIFYLLYAAIMIILSQENKYSKTIVSIVTAAILINFSFFIVSVGIDASNLVSQAIYNAIIPTNNSAAASQIISGSDSSGSGTTQSGISKLASNMSGMSYSGNVAQTQSGIKDIFLNALKIQQLYDPNLGLKAAIGDPIKVILIGIVGVIMMITTSASFILAAIAFVIRMVILLFVLAFSSIIFASIVLPNLKEHTKELVNQLKDMLIFMPLYLLLMYVALRIVNDSNIIGAANVNLGSSSSIKNWMFGYIVLGINFTMVIIILNLPLVAGLKFSKTISKALGKSIDTFGAKNIWGKVSSYAGRNTVGSLANSVDKRLSNTKFFGGTVLGRDIRSGTVGALAKAKMGTGRSYEELAKDEKEAAKKSKEIDRRHDFARALADTKANRAPANGKPTLKDAIGKLNEKEKLALGAEKLKDLDVLKHLKSSDFDAIKKSDDISDDDKREIADKRKEALNDAIAKRQVNETKNMIDNMDGKDLLKLDPSVLQQLAVIAHLKPSQLKTMADEGLDDSIKRQIGNRIDTWLTPHKSKGFINKNRAEWT